MSLFHNSKQKLRNIQRTIDVLLDGDFPLSSGQNALEKLRGVFADLDAKLDRANRLADDQAGAQLGDILNVKLYQSLPILGFILRSTNVRNAFELLEPLQQIAELVLQGRPQLLLSSEWDFVPFAYPQSLEDLRSFVLIGMPATESGSALLVPLAGHELGHAVWRNRGIGGGVLAALQEQCAELYSKNMDDFRKYAPKYDSKDIEYRELLPDSIAWSVDRAVFHAEEMFCDMFAYALFGESYVHAFAYILAPGSGHASGSRYPSHRARLDVLARVAKPEGIVLPNGDTLGFAPDTTAIRRNFALKMAEASVQGIIEALWATVLKLMAEGGVTRPDPEIAKTHVREFQMGIPATHPVCLGDIVNAGWLQYLALSQRDDGPAKLADRVDGLNEMILKTVEVLEYRHRTSDGP